MKPTTVDDYIKNAPKEVQEKLIEIRKIIKETIPDAEEKISYSMPYYGNKRPLAYFAYAKNHIGLYIPPPIVEEHASELKKYKTSKSAVQFPLDEKLPVKLIQKLVKARIKKNETK
jgi:uncharacterized protein YdhG (YjbR/CyaY superfamily)